MIPFTHSAIDTLGKIGKFIYEGVTTNNLEKRTIISGLKYIIKASGEQPMPDVWTDTVGKAIEQTYQLLK